MSNGNADKFPWLVFLISLLNALQLASTILELVIQWLFFENDYSEVTS